MALTAETTKSPVLREQIRQLKAALRESQLQRIRKAEPPDVSRLSQDLSNALCDIQRMQSRVEGFMRTYASRAVSL